MPEKPVDDVCLKMAVRTTAGRFLDGAVDVELTDQRLTDRRVLQSVDASQEILIAGLRRGPEGHYKVTVTPSADYQPQSVFVDIPPSGFATTELTVATAAARPPAPPDGRDLVFPGIEREAEVIRARKEDPHAWALALEARVRTAAHLPGTRIPKTPQGPADRPAFSGDGEASLQSVALPDPGASVGFAGSAVQVLGKDQLDGHLFLPVAGAGKAGIAAESVRVFRWQPESKTYRMIHDSGVRRGEWAWARISSPGIYVPIGLPRDPVASRVLKTAWILSDMTAQADRSAAGEAARSIAAAVIHNIGQFADRDQPGPVWPLPGGPNADLPDYLSGEMHVDRQTLLGILAAGRNPPEYEILADRQAIPAISDHWHFIGPNTIAGMSISLVVDPSNPDTIYTCTADGGIWRLASVSSYPEIGWEPITDGLPTQRTRAFAVAASNAERLYVALDTGAYYRSDDAGWTWRFMSGGNGDVRALAVDSSSADRVYAATSLGLFRSDDGCRSWAGGGALLTGDTLDIALDPDDPAIVFAAVRDRGIVRSRRMGARETWMTVCLWDPRATYWTRSRISEVRVALGRSGPPANRRVAAKLGQHVFFNRAGGDGSWTPLGNVGGANDPGEFQGPNFAHCLAIDPFDDETIFVGQDRLYRRHASRDTDWSVVREYYIPLEDGHPDYHGITFDPVNRGVMYVANDGGVYRSADRGDSWRYLGHTLGTLQCWFQSGNAGDIFLSGVFHHGVFAASASGRGEWQGIEGGSWEFAFGVPDPGMAGVFYVFADNPASRLVRERVRREPGGTALAATRDSDWTRFATRFVAVDPRPESAGMLAGGDDGMYLTRNRYTAGGAAPRWEVQWTALDAGDRLVFAAYGPAVSMGMPQAAYAVTNRGVVFRKLDIEAPGVWERRGQWTGIQARQIVVNAGDLNRVYIVSFDSGVAASDNGGSRFVPIVQNGTAPFPWGTKYSSLISHPVRPRSLVLATYHGIFSSPDEGARWFRFGVGMPNVQIVYVFAHGRFLYAATHGRGLWRHRLT